MSDKAVLIEKKNGVATITMNLPKRMNSLSSQLSRALLESVRDVRDDDSVKVVVLTGSGNAFNAGGDIEVFTKGYTAPEVMEMFDTEYHTWAREFYHLQKPTIAAVNGFAVGAGFGIALLCDIVFAADEAVFGLSFANVGLVPDYMLAYTLPRAIGMQRAKDLFFTARNITAQEAMDFGMVNKVLSKDELMPHAEKYAERLARGPILAYALGKRLLNAGIEENFKNFQTLESLSQSIMLQTSDAKGAADAFLNKRKPEFKGE